MPQSARGRRLVQTGRRHRVGCDGPYCGPEELYLGGRPLIARLGTSYRLRAADEIATLLAAAYGPAADPRAVVPGLRAVAAALQEGDFVHAMIIAVQLRLGAISDDGFARLARADDLLKYNFNPAQPRDAHGRWSDADGGDGAPAAADHPPLLPVQELLPFCARPPLFFDEPPKTFRPFKEPIPRLSGQEGAKDIPSWARGNRPMSARTAAISPNARWTRNMDLATG